MNSFVGTAGWAIPKELRALFFEPNDVKPNHLKAYARRFSGIEINSTFYNDHQSTTFQKWADITPKDFKFSLKLPKRFTHLQKLNIDSADLRSVIEAWTKLEAKLGVILVQLPPKLAFDGEIAETFFAMFRELYDGRIALEPRNESWASREATQVLEEYRISRVVADPDRLPSVPLIRSADFAYYRLHGHPKMYYSDYSEPDVSAWAKRIQSDCAGQRDVWCIFDNTALGHATVNALEMMSKL